MPHPVTDRLADVRRRLRRAGAVRGAALLVVAAVAGAVAAGAVDALLQSDSPAVRLTLTAVAVVPAVWVASVALLPLLRSRVSDVELARRVERRDPTWGGRLSAAAAFLNADPAVGSPELQRKVADEAAARLVARPLPDLVDPERVRWPAFAAAASFLVALLLVAIAPSAAGTALSRLALPFAAIEWPRAVELVLLTEAGEPLPSKIQIGRGQTLRFAVRNRKGDVPDDLTLQVVPPDGRRRSEPVPVAEEPADDGSVRTVGVGSLFAGEGPLRFRVVGGDDRDMPFVTAQVVPPPVFESIKVTVTPPTYLESEPTVLPAGVGGVAGVVGSSVTVEARSNKPLASAELRVGDRPGPKTELGDDGRRVTATFALAEPGLSSYWFRLKDRGGFENPQPPRYELRVAADAVPEVTIAEPPDDLTATTNAALPVLVEASDDYGLAAVRLRFGRGGLPSESSADSGEGGQVIPLFGGPGRPDRGTYPLIWSLEPLRLTPGERLVFRGEATDAFDLGPAHLGTSSPRTVTIVSAVEKREEILDRQDEILDKLTEARRDEERLREATELLLTQIERTGGLRPEDHDLLARTELEQRRLAAALTDPKEGIERRAARTLADLDANRIEDEALEARLDRIRRELAALREDALPAADRDLTAARKAAPGEAAAALAAAKADLDAVLGGLDALLEDLGAWRSRRELGGEVNDLLGTQRELTEETAKAAAETLGTASGQLTDQQAANLERLGLRQAALADRLARLAATVERLAEGDSPRADDPASEAGDPRLEEAAERLRQGGLPAAARAAGESIRGNDLGEAGRLQRELLDGLRQLRESLARSESAGPDAASLRQAAEQLDELAAAQQEVVDTLRKAAESSEGLADEAREALSRRQTELREAAAAAGRRLRDAGADRAAASAGEAARRMSDGLERLLRREDANARQSLEEALEELRRARQEAGRDAQRLEERLAQETAASALGTIAGLSARQAAVNREVARLEALKGGQGRLSRSQLLTLRRTTETQAAVAAETEALADTLDVAPAVSLALRSAAGRMRLLEGALGRRETGEEPQRHGAAAQERLDRIVAALQPKPNDSPSPGEPSEPTGDPEPGGPPGEMIPLAAQLELVKALQEDLLRRTQELDEARWSGTLSEARREELGRLAVEQASLTRLVLRLIGRMEEAIE